MDQALEDEVMAGFLATILPTCNLSHLPVLIGPERKHFAALLDAGRGLGLALSADGVGTKLLVAAATGRYREVGQDLVAMNVNDVLCLGARPVALLDYVALQRVRKDLLLGLAEGLRIGAEEAGVAVVGGEVAQVPEVLAGQGEGFELAGACLGVVPLDRVVDGSRLRPGDTVIGLTSSGLHANGFTLARKVLREAGLSLEDRPPPLGETLAEALLRPTRIYVRGVLALLEEVEVHGLAHITGGGLLNLLRLNPSVGYVLDALPEPPAIFQLLAEVGRIPPEEMYSVFNMGIGFCAVVPPEHTDRALRVLGEAGEEAIPLGSVTVEAATLRLPTRGLVGRGEAFLRLR